MAIDDRGKIQTKDVKQGRMGKHALVILVVSLVLVIGAYIALFASWQ